MFLELKRSSFTKFWKWSVDIEKEVFLFISHNVKGEMKIHRVQDGVDVEL